MFFSHGGATNSHKRGREASAAASASAASNNIAFSGNVIANPCTVQPQPQPLQLIDLFQLHFNRRPHQSVVVSTGLRLSSNDQHQHQQGIVRESVEWVSSPVFSDDLAVHIKQQRDEIGGQFLLAQGEQFRQALAEKPQRHYCDLPGAAEEAAGRRLRKKKAETEKATRHNTEPQARAAQLTVQAQVWQAKMRAQEAAAAWLQDQLQQAIIGGGHNKISREHGGSEVEDGKLAHVDLERVAVASWPGCWACGGRVAAAPVLLPCRHLCVCRECDRVAKACPVCFTARQSSDLRGPSH